MRAHGVTCQTVAGIVAEPQHTRPGYRGATIYAGASLEVVVAEDEALIRLDLVEMLEAGGYDVVAAAGERTAHHLLRRP